MSNIHNQKYEIMTLINILECIIKLKLNISYELT